MNRKQFKWCLLNTLVFTYPYFVKIFLAQGLYTLMVRRSKHHYQLQEILIWIVWLIDWSICLILFTTTNIFDNLTSNQYPSKHLFFLSYVFLLWLFKNFQRFLGLQIILFFVLLQKPYLILILCLNIKKYQIAPFYNL